MLLIDTNVWFELLYHRPLWRDVQAMLDRFSDEIAVSLFSVYSIGINANGRGRPEAFRQFLDELLARSRVIEIAPNELLRVQRAVESLRIGFDDAYQYVAAEVYGCDLISFDHHFDSTPRGRKTPAQVLA